MIKKVVFVLVLVALFGAATVQAQDGVGGFTSGTLNLRSGPSTGCDILTTIPYGSGIWLQAKSSDGGWYYLDWGGIRGWIYAGNFAITVGFSRDLPIKTDPACTTPQPTATPVVVPDDCPYIEAVIDHYDLMAVKPATCEELLEGFAESIIAGWIEYRDELRAFKSTLNLSEPVTAAVVDFDPALCLLPPEMEDAATMYDGSCENVAISFIQRQMELRISADTAGMRSPLITYADCPFKATQVILYLGSFPVSIWEETPISVEEVAVFYYLDGC